jgi:hypothetical protein
MSMVSHSKITIDVPKAEDAKYGFPLEINTLKKAFRSTVIVVLL